MIQRYQPGLRLSQAVVANGLIFIAGQVADESDVGIEAQTQSVLAKIEELLRQAGSDKTKLLMVDIYLPHMLDFDAMTRVYDAWIDIDHPASRACVEARLADPDLRVEMTAIASL